MPSKRRRTAPAAEVVDLGWVRARRRLLGWQRKVEDVVDANRRAVGRLYTTGALFSKEGTRVGRDLLLAHQHLLKVQRLLGRLCGEGPGPSPREPAAIEAIYEELDQLVDRAALLTDRTGTWLERLRTDER